MDIGIISSSVDESFRVRIRVEQQAGFGGAEAVEQRPDAPKHDERIVVSFRG